MSQPNPMSQGLAVIELARLRFYDECDTCKLSRAEQAVLRTIRRRTFDRGQTRAWIPNLRCFILDNWFGDTRLDKADVSRAIDELERLKIIMAPPRQAKRRSAGWYGINVIWERWDAQRKKPSSASEQMWMELEEPDLDEALRRTFVEFGGNSPPMMPQGEGSAPRPVPGAPTAGCVRDAIRTPAGDQAAGPLLGKTATGPPETRSPVGAERANSPQRGCWENPNRPSPGSAHGVGKIPTAAVLPAVDGPESVAVGKIPTPGVGAGVVSPRTPLPGVRNETEQRSNRSCSGDLTETVRARARGAVGIFPTRRVTRDEEARFIELLTEFFASPSEAHWEHEMKRSEDFWRLRVVRNCPDALEEGLARGRDLERTGYNFDWKPAWLSTDVKKQVGIRHWDELKNGPEPI